MSDTAQRVKKTERVRLFIAERETERNRERYHSVGSPFVRERVREICNLKLGVSGLKSPTEEGAKRVSDIAQRESESVHCRGRDRERNCCPRHGKWVVRLFIAERATGRNRER